MPPPRVAIVHDWFDKPGRAERVPHELIECFPDADLFAIVDMLPAADRGRIIGDRIVTTSFIHKLPAARKHFRPHQPIRYAWDQQRDYLRFEQLDRGVKGVVGCLSPRHLLV